MYQVSIYKITPHETIPLTAKFFRTHLEAELWVRRARLENPRCYEYDIKKDDYYCEACGMSFYNCLCSHDDD